LAQSRLHNRHLRTSELALKNVKNASHPRRGRCSDPSSSVMSFSSSLQDLHQPHLYCFQNLHQPSVLAFHLFAMDLATSKARATRPIITTVPKTATINVRTLNVEIWHWNDLALRSQRSLHNGQISASHIGANICG